MATKVMFDGKCYNKSGLMAIKLGAPPNYLKKKSLNARLDNAMSTILETKKALEEDEKCIKMSMQQLLKFYLHLPNAGEHMRRYRMRYGFKEYRFHFIEEPNDIDYYKISRFSVTIDYPVSVITFEVYMDSNDQAQWQPVTPIKIMPEKY